MAKARVPKRDKLIEKMVASDGVNVMDELRHRGNSERALAVIRAETIVIGAEAEAESWGIFVEGNRVALWNGKRVWNTRAYARAALTDKVKSDLMWSGTSDRTMDHAEYEETMAYMEAKGIIEFKRVDL